MRRPLALLFATLLALAPWAASATAGATEELRRGDLHVVHPTGKGALALHVVALCEQAVAVLRRDLGLAVGPARVVLVEGHGAVIREVGGHVPPWALAVAVSRRGLVVVRLDKIETSRNRLGPTLIHELAHLAQGALERRAGRRLPLWFEEGVCEWVSGEMHAGAGGQLALDASLGSLFRLDELRDEFPSSAAAADLAYAQSRAFVTWLDAHHEGALVRTLKAFEAGAAFDDALAEATGRPLDELEQAWTASVTPRYPALYAVTQLASWGLLMSLLVVLAFVRRRRRDRELLDEMPEFAEERALYGWKGPLEP